MNKVSLIQLTDPVSKLKHPLIIITCRWQSSSALWTPIITSSSPHCGVYDIKHGSKQDQKECIFANRRDQYRDLDKSEFTTVFVYEMKLFDFLPVRKNLAANCQATAHAAAAAASDTFTRVGRR